MSRRILLRAVHGLGERTVFGFVAGAGSALLYAAVIAATVDKQAMIVGLLLLGVAALVLTVAVLRVAHPVPREDERLPAVVDQAMARERRAHGPRSRVVEHGQPRTTDATVVLARVVDEPDTTVSIPTVYGGRP